MKEPVCPKCPLLGHETTTPFSDFESLSKLVFWGFEIWYMLPEELAVECLLSPGPGVRRREAIHPLPSPVGGVCLWCLSYL